MKKADTIKGLLVPLSLFHFLQCQREDEVSAMGREGRGGGGEREDFGRGENGGLRLSLDDGTWETETFYRSERKRKRASPRSFEIDDLKKKRSVNIGSKGPDNTYLCRREGTSCL